MNADAFERKKRMVYAYIVDKEIIYIGSSGCSLKTLEFNHRNALTKYLNQKHTFFRRTLAVDKEIQKGKFKLLLQLEGITQPEIEDLEGQLIRAFTPMYNKDMDPVSTSSTWGQRY